MVTYYREKEWTDLIVTWCLRHLFDNGCVSDRKWTSPFLEVASYQQRREHPPEAYWPAILISQDMFFPVKKGITFEACNPQLCARRFGVMQACVIPFGKAMGVSLTLRCTRPMDDAHKLIPKLSTFPHVRPLPSINRSARSLIFRVCGWKLGPFSRPKWYILMLAWSRSPMRK